ncbi:R.Pab1 family restriction endonuclease [Campylobacter cuniculorum]|uniref:Type II restriction endonuclease, PabI family n=2 Tax=Campylobacter cuniculorum TaxID=374106 RepID=A0A1W6BUS4_9BACT|nr:R.Pab1 family restriction endonuclease [Campylobacter cuniculorum]ARJ55836.1 type II restriction endonuclease, PabI family [Campylobacter cuniculorum DSM 23162 = LMG 24588]QOR05053.1 R.Pab1 family restriction endonuclease [Campylobacter cuniculorum]
MHEFKMLYELALTAVGGKIRIKERHTFNDYGKPIAPTQTKINIKHYIEWQIGYDEVVKKDAYHFVGANKKFKKLYELSDIIWQFYRQNIIKKETLLKLKTFLENNDALIEDKMQINRSVFKPLKIAHIDFLESKISYPLLVYSFKNNNFLSEIVIKEKQKAIGIQAMLFFCFPLYLLKDSKGKESFLGRKIQSKEKGYLEINEKNIDIFIQMLKIFGILSPNHKYDLIQILNFILKT